MKQGMGNSCKAKAGDAGLFHSPFPIPYSPLLRATKVHIPNSACAGSQL